MSLQVNQEELLDIVVKYAEVEGKNGRVYILTREEDFVKYKDKIKEIKQLNTQWKEPTWKEQNAIVQESQVMNGLTGDRIVDYVKLDELMLEKCLKNWDLLDSKGKSIQCTPENIGTLNPQFAQKLINEFSLRNSISDKNLGN